ncbi:inositol monophosphatase family protein [Nanoarchaeota archaeon]
MASPRTEVLKRALLEGSKHILTLFGKPMDEIDVKYKPKDGDTPSTIMDTFAERDILRVINESQLFRDYTINAEESGISGSGERILLIDPLDGTSNIPIGHPTSTMGVGIVEEGGLVASIILDPFEQRLYWAEKGNGSFVGRLERKETKLYLTGNETKIVTDTSSKPASRKYVWIDSFFNENTTQRKLEWMKRMQEAGFFWNARMVGSSLFHSKEIAKGDGQSALIDAVGGPWDLCGYNLVEEAGGRMVNIHGEGPQLGDQVAIAVANPRDLETVLKITQDCYKDYEGFR